MKPILTVCAKPTDEAKASVVKARNLSAFMSPPEAHSWVPKCLIPVGSGHEVYNQCEGREGGAASRQRGQRGARPQVARRRWLRPPVAAYFSSTKSFSRTAGSMGFEKTRSHPASIARS